MSHTIDGLGPHPCVSAPLGVPAMNGMATEVASSRPQKKKGAFQRPVPQFLSSGALPPVTPEASAPPATPTKLEPLSLLEEEPDH